MSIIQKYWKQWLASGTKPEMPSPLQQRIYLSNQLGIIIALIAVFVLILFSFRPNFNPSSLLLLILVALSITGLNRLGFTALARLILSIAPSLGTLALNLSIKIHQAEQVALIHYISPRLFMISTIAIPLILFSSREFRYAILGVLIISVNTFWTYEYLHNYLDLDYASLGIEAEKYSVVYEDIILILITLLGTLLFLRRINHRHEQEVEDLLNEANEKQKIMQKNQAQLSQTLEEVRQTRQEEQMRNWISKGLADFASLLRQHQEAEQLYRRFIAELVNYTEANQAGLYLLEEKMQGDRCLHLAACYAYNRQQYQKKHIMIGEGLIGQAAQDRSRKYIEDLPENYSRIASSLGEASPKYLLIVPLIFNEDIEGVLEIASFQAFAPVHIEFVEKLGESIAAYISGQRSQDRNQRLLEQSQQMFDRLQALQNQAQAKEQAYQREIAALRKRLEQGQVLSGD